jgi:hypothetical protein
LSTKEKAFDETGYSLVVMFIFVLIGFCLFARADTGSAIRPANRSASDDGFTPQGLSRHGRAATGRHPHTNTDRDSAAQRYADPDANAIGHRYESAHCYPNSLAIGNRVTLTQPDEQFYAGCDGYAYEYSSQYPHSFTDINPAAGSDAYAYKQCHSHVDTDPTAGSDADSYSASATNPYVYPASATNPYVYPAIPTNQYAYSVF